MASPPATSAATDGPALVVHGLCNSFGNQVIHKDLDLEVRRGEIIGVVGGSGTGKSVLMRAILGLRRPQAGQIEVLGVDALSENTTKRLEKLQEIRRYLSVASGQLDLIENSFQLIADQIVTMQSPNELSGQLDDLLDGVDSIRQTAIDTEKILSGLENA